MGSPKKTIQYRYGARGNRRALVDQDGGRFTYSSDAGRISQLLNSQGRPTSFSYDAGGRRTIKQLSNGIRTSFSYDSNVFVLTLILAFAISSCDSKRMAGRIAEQSPFESSSSMSTGIDPLPVKWDFVILRRGTNNLEPLDLAVGAAGDCSLLPSWFYSDVIAPEIGELGPKWAAAPLAVATGPANSIVLGTNHAFVSELDTYDGNVPASWDKNTSRSCVIGAAAAERLKAQVGSMIRLGVKTAQDGYETRVVAVLRSTSSLLDEAIVVSPQTLHGLGLDSATAHITEECDVRFVTGSSPRTVHNADKDGGHNNPAWINGIALRGPGGDGYGAYILQLSKHYDCDVVAVWGKDFDSGRCKWRIWRDTASQ